MNEINHEEKARSDGWMPKEDFKGDPERWVDAETFNKRGEEYIPFIKATNRKLESKLKTTESTLGATQSELNQLKGVVEKLATVNENVSKRAYDQAMATIRKEQASAISEGDAEKWQALDVQKDALEKPEKIDVPKAVQDPHGPGFQEAFNEWKGENNWYGTDVELTDFAMHLGNKFAAQGIFGTTQLEKIKDQIKTTFPLKFTNSRRNEQNVDASDNVPLKKSGKTTYESLDTDLKKHCDDLMRQIPGYTKEKYIQDLEA